MSSFDEAVKRLLEAPEDEPWGDVAWGEERQEDGEPNTTSEEEALEDIKKHFNDDAKLPKSRAQQIQTLAKDERYSDILDFDESKHPVLYRGMGVAKDYLAKILRINPKELTQGVYDVDFLAKPVHDTASWSIDQRSARRFATAFGYKGAGIVLHAKASDNPGAFLLNTEQIYTVGPLRPFKPEKEVIGVGPIVVHKIEVIEVEEWHV